MRLSGGAGALLPGVGSVAVKSLAPMVMKPATGAMASIGAKPAGTVMSGARTSAACAVNSYVPGTAVLLANGTAIPIEDIRLGDEVLATDPLTGHTGAQKVITLIEGNGQKHLGQSL